MKNKLLAIFGILVSLNIQAGVYTLDGGWTFGCLMR